MLTDPRSPSPTPLPSPVPSYQQIAALVERARDGKLTRAQAGQVAELLDAVGAAVRIAGRAPDEYPDDPHAQAAYTLGAWSNVEAAFRALLGGAR